MVGLLKPVAGAVTRQEQKPFRGNETVIETVVWPRRRVLP
jgi:hypothetical protein